MNDYTQESLQKLSLSKLKKIGKDNKIPKYTTWKTVQDAINAILPNGEEVPLVAEDIPIAVVEVEPSVDIDGMNLTNLKKLAKELKKGGNLKFKHMMPGGTAVYQVEMKKKCEDQGGKYTKPFCHINGERIHQMAMGKPNDGDLHAIIIKKKGYDKNDAVVEAAKFKTSKGLLMRETKLSYRFRNIPKTKFNPKSFRSKKINKNITLVYGELK